MMTIKKANSKESEEINLEENEVKQNEAVEANENLETEVVTAEKNEIEELESTIPEKEEYEDSIMKLSDALDALLDKELEAGVKNAYLKEIVSRIEFSRENNDEFILDIVLK